MNHTELLITYFKLNEEERKVSSIAYSESSLQNDGKTIANSYVQQSKVGVKDYSAAFRYSVSENGVVIDEYIGSEEEVIIPETIDGKSVNAINRYFSLYSKNNEKIKRIFLPQSVKLIDPHSFEFFTSLEEIYIDDCNPSYSHIDGVVYNKSKTELIYCPHGKKDNVVIPDTVIRICDEAFAGYEKLYDIIIPNGVKYIGEGAFTGCVNLKSIIIPNHVINIGEYAFAGCESLKEIVVPDSVTELGYGAFRGCTSLKNVVLSKKLTIIKIGTFSKCSSLLNISIPGYVKEIGDEAFGRCDSIKSISIPRLVNKIGFLALFRCENLTEIVVDNSNLYFSSIDGVLFSKDKTSLVIYPSGRKGDYTVPAGVQKIEPYAFSGCLYLKKITLSDCVTTIDKNAFLNCDELREICVPKSVSIIDTYAFADCSSIDKILISKENKNYSSIDAVLFDRKKQRLISFPDEYCPSYSVPPSVKSIAERAFKGRRIKEIILPDNLKEIEYSAFAKTQLKKMIIPDSVTQIDHNAFKGCEELRQVSLPQGLKKIEYGVFEHCDNLSEVYIPDSVTEISWSAFYFCKKIRFWVHRNSYALEYAKRNNLPYGLCNGNPYITEVEKKQDVFQGFVFKLYSYSIAAKKLGKPCGGSQASVSILRYNGVLPEVTVPEKINQTPVKDIQFGAFFDSQFMRCLVISSSVETISFLSVESYPDDIGLDFSNYDSLEKIIVSPENRFFSSKDGVLFDKEEKILLACPNGKKGFYTISEGVAEIGEFAFSNCKQLSRITVPSSVTTIGFGAFENCPNLKIYAPAKSPIIDYAKRENITIQEIVCPDLAYIYKLNGIMPFKELLQASLLLSDYAHQFEYKEINQETAALLSNKGSLSKIIIPSHVDGFRLTVIENNAFANNKNLESVRLPDGVTEIRSEVFLNCVNLNELHIPSSVKKIDDNAFKGCKKLIITTPKGSYVSTCSFKSSAFRKIPIKTI